MVLVGGRGVVLVGGSGGVVLVGGRGCGTSGWEGVWL